METLSTVGYFGFAVGILILFVIGLPLQILNLSALFHKVSIKKELTPFLVNISVANLIFMFASFPSSFVSAIQQRWAFNNRFCIAEGFFSGTASIAMVFFLTVIVAEINKAIDGLRFVAELNRRSYNKTIQILMVWMFSIAVMLPPSTGLTAMAIEGGGTNCAPDWRPATTGSLIYALFLTICAFFVPIGMSIRHLYKIYHSLSKHTHMCKQRMNVQAFIEYRTVSRIIGTAIFLYIVTWTPYCLGVLVSLFGANNLMAGELSLLPTIIAKSSAVYIPIVYITFNGRLRRTILRIIRTKLKPSSRVKPLSITRQTTDDAFTLQRICLTNLTSTVGSIPDMASTNTLNRYTERRGAIRCGVARFI